MKAVRLRMWGGLFWMARWGLVRSVCSFCMVSSVDDSFAEERQLVVGYTEANEIYRGDV